MTPSIDIDFLEWAEEKGYIIDSSNEIQAWQELGSRYLASLMEMDTEPENDIEEKIDYEQ